MVLGVEERLVVAKDRTEAILANSNAKLWQAELVADLSVRLGDSLDGALEFAKSMFGGKDSE